jgi:hypothetical protein
VEWEAWPPPTPFSQEAVPCRPKGQNVRDLRLWLLDHTNRSPLLTNCVVRSWRWMSSLVCLLGRWWQCQVCVTQLLLWLVTRSFSSPGLNCRDLGLRPTPLKITDYKHWRYRGSDVTWRTDAAQEQPIPMMTNNPGTVSGNGRINWYQRSLRHEVTMTQSLDLQNVPEWLANFAILTLIFFLIFRRAEGTKLGFVLKEWMTRPFLWPRGYWQHSSSQCDCWNTATLFLMPSPRFPGKWGNENNPSSQWRNWGTINIKLNPQYWKFSWPYINLLHVRLARDPQFWRKPPRLQHCDPKFPRQLSPCAVIYTLVISFPFFLSWIIE